MVDAAADAGRGLREPADPGQDRAGGTDARMRDDADIARHRLAGGGEPRRRHLPAGDGLHAAQPAGEAQGTALGRVAAPQGCGRVDAGPGQDQPAMNSEQSRSPQAKGRPAASRR